LLSVAVQVTNEVPSELGLRVRERCGGALSVVVPGVIYLALACAVYWPISPFDASHVVGCACGDAVQQAWFLHWVAFALGNGHNPIFSTYLNAPDGANLAVNTSMPLLGILGWPMTSLSNSIAAYNLLLRLSLALSALSMYLVLRGYVRSRAAAFVGALLFGFSPYMLAEGRLHVFLVFLPLLPPLIPLTDRWLVRADRSPYRCGALIGLVLGLEMWISAELAAVFVIFAVIALIPLAIRHRELVRSRLPLLPGGLGAAAIVGSLVGGYVIWMLVAGPQRPVGPPHSVANLDSFHADLLSAILPSRPQLFRPPLLHDVGEQFVRGVVHENGFYLGIPLLALLVVGAVRLRRHALVSSFAMLGVISFVLGLGTRLTVANHVTPIPLPVAAITRVPLLQEVGPTRFALAIQLAASVLLALELDRILQRPILNGIRRPTALVGVSLVVLVPLAPNGFVKSVDVRVPDYFSSSAVTEIPNGATVLPYPYPYYTGNVAMLWQIASHMRFRIPGGEVYVPSPTRTSTNYPHGDLPPELWAVLINRGRGGPTARRWHAPSAQQRTRLVSDLRSYVTSHSVDAMVVLVSGAQGRWVAGLTTSAFGAPTGKHGDVSVWLKPFPS
jgi:hypothetical protein